MYLIRDKKSKEVLFMDPFIKDNKTDAKTLYPGFNGKTMEICWSAEEQLPEHYKIDKNEKIKPLTLEEQVKEGLLTLLATEKIENGEIVTKTLEEQYNEGLLHVDEPFQYIDTKNNTFAKRSLEEVVNGKMLKTKAQCEKALEMLGEKIEEAIGGKYNPGDEVKTMKNYLYWLDEAYHINRESKFSRKELSNAEKEIAGIQAQLTDINANYNNLNVQINGLNQQIQNFKTIMKSTPLVASAFKAQLKPLENQKTKIEKELEKVKNQKAGLEKQMSIVKKKRDEIEKAINKVAEKTKTERENARDKFIEMKDFTDNIKGKFGTLKDDILKITSSLKK